MMHEKISRTQHTKYGLVVAVGGSQSSRSDRLPWNVFESRIINCRMNLPKCRGGKWGAMPRDICVFKFEFFQQHRQHRRINVVVYFESNRTTKAAATKFHLYCGQ